MSNEDKELIEARLAAKRTIAGDFSPPRGPVWTDAPVPDGTALTAEFLRGFEESIPHSLTARIRHTVSFMLEPDGTFTTRRFVTIPTEDA